MKQLIHSTITGKMKFIMVCWRLVYTKPGDASANTWMIICMKNYIDRENSLNDFFTMYNRKAIKRFFFQS